MISSRWNKRELAIVNHFYDQLSKNGDSLDKIIFLLKCCLDEDRDNFHKKVMEKLKELKDDEHNLNHNFYPIRTERAIAIKLKNLNKINEEELKEIEELIAKKKRKERRNPIRNKVLERDNHSCVMCGKKDNLEVDHIIEFFRLIKPEHKIENLITLCKEHHKLKTNLIMLQKPNDMNFVKEYIKVVNRVLGIELKHKVHHTHTKQGKPLESVIFSKKGTQNDYNT